MISGQAPEAPAAARPSRPSTPAWDPECVAATFDVSRETIGLLERYIALLSKWQQRINLVGRSTLDDVWGRHIADSLQLAPLAPPDAKTWLDLGSGAGLPGLVLAIALRDVPRFHMHLVESNARKCAFLTAAIAALKVPAIVHHTTIEALGASESRPRADVITARALAPLSRLLPLAEPFMWKKTVLLFPKGQDVGTELTEAAISSTLMVDHRPSLVEPAATILRIEEAQR